MTQSNLNTHGDWFDEYLPRIRHLRGYLETEEEILEYFQEQYGDTFLTLDKVHLCLEAAKILDDAN